MNDFIHLNRLSAKCLEMISVVSKIHDTSKSLVISPDQSNIDNLSVLVSEFQNISSQIPECLVTLLKEAISQEEILETDAIETEDGYKL